MTRPAHRRPGQSRKAQYSLFVAYVIAVTGAVAGQLDREQGAVAEQVRAGLERRHVRAKDGREELGVECVLNGSKEGSYVRDDAANVLPFCHEAADKTSVGQVGKLFCCQAVNALYQGVDHRV